MISERHSLQWSTVMLKRKSHNRLPVRKSQVQTANLVLGPAADRGRISLTLTGKDIDVYVLSGAALIINTLQCAFQTEAITSSRKSSLKQPQKNAYDFPLMCKMSIPGIFARKPWMSKTDFFQTAPTSKTPGDWRTSARFCPLLRCVFGVRLLERQEQFCRGNHSRPG
jgi:hypothetical protein